MLAHGLLIQLLCSTLNGRRGYTYGGCSVNCPNTSFCTGGVGVEGVLHEEICEMGESVTISMPHLQVHPSCCAQVTVVQVQPSGNPQVTLR